MQSTFVVHIVDEARKLLDDVVESRSYGLPRRPMEPSKPLVVSSSGQLYARIKWDSSTGRSKQHFGERRELRPMKKFALPYGSIETQAAKVSHEMTRSDLAWP